MRLPWQVPDDPERRAMMPRLDLRERLRLALKVPVPFVAYIWFQTDQTAASALVAFAGAVGTLSAIELVWLRTTTPAERIFTKTKRQAVFLHVAVLAACAAALVVAIPRLR
ncbi:MAG TPA: hypothetical protein VEV43_11245 [Actinomycetota bacterium]|nr:hypothetical protein [Actinomycetota bacterium]